MNETTIFIIDDDPSAREGLLELVAASGMLAESFSSAKDFLTKKKYKMPGCIILDLKMPEMSGPDLQDELIKTGFDLPIIFLSGHADIPITASTMKKGALNFLTKPVDVNDLIKAIHEALELIEKNQIKAKKVIQFNQEIKALTPREYEIMTYVITGMQNKQIANELGISEETVKIHRGRVIHKLNKISVAELVRCCEMVGIDSPLNKS